MRNALNEVLRDWYVEDCRSGIERWNKKIAAHGIDFRFSLPDRKFNRQIGVFAGLRFDPVGPSRQRGRVAAPPRRLAAVGRRHRLSQDLQAIPVYEPGQVRQLHRAAAPRRQPAADRLRVRPDGAEIGHEE